MSDLTKEQRSILIRLCKERVAANGIAYIHRVSQDHKADIGIESGINFPEAERVAHILVREDIKYEFVKSDNMVYAVRLNPNYELSESVLKTNENVRKTNEISLRIGTKTNLIAVVTGVFILASVLVAGLQYAKTDEKLKPLLQQIDTTLQTQSKEQDSLKQTMRIVNSRLATILDSLSKKP